MTAESATTINVQNPADGSASGSVPIESAETVAAKAAKLRAAQPEWEDIGPSGRKRWLLALQGWILDNAARLTDVLITETGKSHTDA